MDYRAAKNTSVVHVNGLGLNTLCKCISYNEIYWLCPKLGIGALGGSSFWMGIGVAWGGMGSEVWDFHFLKGLFLKIWRMFWLEG